MEFSKFSKFKLRYYSLSSLLSSNLLTSNSLSNPIPQSIPAHSFSSSTGFSSFLSQTCSSFNSLSLYRFSSNGCSSNPNFNICFSPNAFFRSYYVSSLDVSDDNNKGIDGFTPKSVFYDVRKIVNLVRTNEDDFESKLCSLNMSQSVFSVTEVFRLLNREKVSGLRFFNWITSSQPELGRNSDICSLVIDNCGCLDDFDAMELYLNDFKLNNIRLAIKAYGFLRGTIASDDSTKKSTQRVVNLLHKVGGSCYASGIRSLIEMFSVSGSFSMAKFVIERTERTTRYYNILIKEMCKRCDFNGAKTMLHEMRKEGCDPSAQTYNYLISSLLNKGCITNAQEVFDEMLEKNCPYDSLTFEIFIYYCCGHGMFHLAFQFLDDMVARGIEPRISTHSAFIKGFFNRQRYDDAYKYVVDSCDKFKLASNANYSLLASLHHKGKNLDIAQTVLSEMMKKGLRPNFSIYVKVLKQLKKFGREKLAMDLQEWFLQLKQQ